MLRTLSRAALSAFTFSCPVLAQAGNEVIFVGASTSGNTDPHYFVESGTLLVPDRGGVPQTNNVTGAAWTQTGRTLYVANGLPPGGVSMAQWNGSAATWSGLFGSSRGCYGLGLDVGRQRLWTLESASGFNELTCIDLVPNSPTFGASIAQTTTLSGAIRERWALAPTGNFALVPHLLLGSGTVDLVDTNPTSPTFLQTILSLPLPGAISSGISMVADVEFTADEQHAVLCYTGPGFAKIAALNIPTGAFVDFNPNAAGQQDFSLGLSVASSLDLSASGSFAVVTGIGSGGWCTRVLLDWAIPGNTTQQNVAITGLPNCNGVSISPEETRFAFTTWATTTPPSAPSYLSIHDVATGAQLHRLTMNSAWNCYTTAWQDGSPIGTYSVFGSGCNGAAGVLLMRAASGSRPGLGLTFAQEIFNVPSNIAIASLGFTNAQSGGIPLPLDLSVIGMSGCSMLVDPERSTFLFTPTTVAAVSYGIPNDAIFFGLPFYTQGWALDAAANAAGWISSDAGMALIGF